MHRLLKIENLFKKNEQLDQDAVTNNHVLQSLMNGSLRSTEAHLFEEADLPKTEKLQPSPTGLFQVLLKWKDTVSWDLGIFPP